MNTLETAVQKASIKTFPKKFLNQLAELEYPTERDEMIMQLSLISEGLPLLNLRSLVRSSIREDGWPAIAVAEAATHVVYAKIRHGDLYFGDRYGAEDFKFEDWPGVIKPDTYVTANVPYVPVEVRPKDEPLDNFVVAWEADWDILPEPKDPILLKQIDGDVYGIVATWDLTELELAAMRVSRIL